MLPRFLLALGLVSCLGLPAQVVINEVFTGTPDAIELRNLGTSAVDVSGWTVSTFQGTTATLAAETPFTIPSGTLIAPNGFLLLVEFGTAGQPNASYPCGISTGFNYNWTSTRSVAVVVRDAASVGIDYVYRGPTGTPNLPANLSWTGTLSTAGDTIARAVDVDTNAAIDFQVLPSASFSPCTFNPGQNVPPPPITLDVLTSGSGDLSLSIDTFPAQSSAEYFHLISTQIFNPAGSGPVLGVGLDVLPQFGFPLEAGSPIHGRLDAQGSYLYQLPPGVVPAGLRVQTVAIVIRADGSLLISEVSDTTF